MNKFERIKIYQQKVYDCLQKVNIEVKKIKNVSQALRAKLTDIILSDCAKEFGLTFTNVKIIYYGKTKL